MEVFDKRMLDVALRTDFISFINKVVNTVNPASPHRCIVPAPNATTPNWRSLSPAESTRRVGEPAQRQLP